MIHVVAIVRVLPGKRTAVLEAIRANLPAVHAEQGCIEYLPAIGFEGLVHTQVGPDTIFVIEKWTDEKALRAHAESAHMAAYAAKVKDLIVSREIYVLTPA